MEAEACARAMNNNRVDLNVGGCLGRFLHLYARAMA
jgi:hypothetical protein